MEQRTMLHDISRPQLRAKRVATADLPRTAAAGCKRQTARYWWMSKYAAGKSIEHVQQVWILAYAV